ncbi:hypothetical protein [Leptolyngbya ohadii]|uniref:hypothetical protein n=1 Tax=Leptolyngbya ohadii TaxID=1962290 RepID=UPI000B5A018D|nr:hypothetical protein [Leptolyngbya ohadii]
MESSEGDYLEILQLLEAGDTDLAFVAEEMARERGDLRGVLLSMLYDTPSAETWERLIAAVDEWEEDEIPAALTQVQAALDRWSDILRTAPAHWWNQAQTTPPIAWSIVRALIVNTLEHDYEPCENASSLAALTIIDVENTLVSLEDLQAATSLTHLRYLFAIDDSFVRQEQLDKIGVLHRLRSLTLTISQSPDLTWLKGLSELRSLSLTFAIRQAHRLNLSVLSQLTHLEHLTLANEFEPLPSLESIAALPLKSLTLKRLPIAIQPLVTLSQLQQIDLSDVPQWLTGDRFPATLTTVQLHDVQGMTSLDSFSDAAGLQTLQVFRSPDLNDISALSRFPTLQMLVLEDTALSTIANLDQAASLADLRLHANQYLTGIQGHLPQLSLQQLVIAQSPLLTDISGVGSLRRLNRLLLSRLDQLSDLAPLSHLIELEELVLEQCPEVQSIAAIASLTALQRLYISQCPGLSDAEIFSTLAALNAAVYLDGQWIT